MSERVAHRAAVEAGYASLEGYIESNSDKPCAPNAAMRMVEIERGVFEEFQVLAKRTHTTPQVAINAALNEWLGRT